MGAKKSKTKKKPARAAARATTTKKPKKALKASPKKKTPALKKKAAPKARPAPKKAAPKPPSKASTPKPAKPKPSAARPAATRPTSKSLADRVRDCDAGTPVWFTVAGGIEHATVLRLGEDGAAVIRTDAGTIAVVSPSNLFETADQARAARSR